MSTTFSQSPASIASRKAFDPLVFVRSPTMSTPASCRKGTAEYSEAAAGSTTGVRSTTSWPRTRSTTCRRCSGVVPQQPPTRPTPYVRTNSSSASASSTGCRGYSAPCLPSCGRPAFGITDSGTVACCDR